MKILKKTAICLSSLMLSFAILYSEMVFSLPEEIMMFYGQQHSSSLIPGVKIKAEEDVFQATAKNTVTPEREGEYTASLFVGTIPVRKIQVNVTSEKSLCASGCLVGLRLYNRGLIVTDTKTFLCENNKSESPAALSGIIPGDVIVKINGTQIMRAVDVAPLLKDGENTLELTRDNRSKTLVVTPKRDSADNMLKLGVLVRDSTAGVGTLTYFDPESGRYGALGHGISDSDTGVMFDILKGSIEKSSVVSVKKGQRGEPGEICGSFSSGGIICGTAEKNCESGIFGTLSGEAQFEGRLLPVGLISQVHPGNATILSTVDNETREYGIKILRTIPFGSAAKSMMIKVTDPELLEKTGGIIQGMSGSPIIQDGRIVGAVTHVLINDPACGYGIYVEKMFNVY